MGVLDDLNKAKRFAVIALGLGLETGFPGHRPVLDSSVRGMGNAIVALLNAALDSDDDRDSVGFYFRTYLFDLEDAIFRLGVDYRKLSMSTFTVIDLDPIYQSLKTYSGERDFLDASLEGRNEDEITMILFGAIESVRVSVRRDWSSRGEATTDDR